MCHFFLESWYMCGSFFKSPVARPYQNQTWVTHRAFSLDKNKSKNISSYKSNLSEIWPYTCWFPSVLPPVHHYLQVLYHHTWLIAMLLGYLVPPLDGKDPWVESSKDTNKWQLYFKTNNNHLLTSFEVFFFFFFQKKRKREFKLWKKNKIHM